MYTVLSVVFVSVTGTSIVSPGLKKRGRLVLMTTDSRGRFRTRAPRSRGKYYVTVPRTYLTRLAECAPDTSPKVRVRRR